MKSLVVAVILLMAVSASATTFTINQEIDLQELTFAPGIAYGLYANPVTLSEGDRLLLNYTFTGGQQLRMTDTSDGWEMIRGWVSHDGVPPNVSYFTVTGTMSFIGLSGTPGITFADTQSSGATHFGLDFYSPDIVRDGESIQFSGLSFNMSVDDFTDPGVTTLKYFGPWVQFGASKLEVVSGFPVPEPGSAALLSLGFIGLFLGRRVCRRRRPKR